MSDLILVELPLDPITVVLDRGEIVEALKARPGAIVRRWRLRVLMMGVAGSAVLLALGWSVVEVLPLLVIGLLLVLTEPLTTSLRSRVAGSRSTVVQFDDVGLEIRRGRRVWHHPWSAVRGVTETPTLVCLWLRRGGLALPRRCFHTHAEADAVVAAATVGTTGTR